MKSTSRHNYVGGTSLKAGQHTRSNYQYEKQKDLVRMTNDFLRKAGYGPNGEKLKK